MLDKMYAFIVQYKTNHDGNAPTVRQIMRSCGLVSTSTTWLRLMELEKKGLIFRIGGQFCIRGATWTPPAQGRGEA